MPPTVLDLEFQRIFPRQWKSVALRGLVALLFGVVILIFPLFWVQFLAIVFAAFVFADGVVALLAGWRMHKLGVSWWPYLVVGVSGVLFGVIAVVNLPLAIMATVYVVGFWAIFGGIFQIVSAVRLRDIVDTETLMIISGLLSLVFGVLLILTPGLTGGLVLTVLIGFYTVIYGVMLLFVAYRLRSMSQVD